MKTKDSEGTRNKTKFKKNNKGIGRYGSLKITHIVKVCYILSPKVTDIVRLSYICVLVKREHIHCQRRQLSCKYLKSHSDSRYTYENT